jgi:hypothetical protein
MRIILFFLVSLITSFAPVYSSTNHPPHYAKCEYGLRGFKEDPNSKSITFQFEGSEFIAEKYFGLLNNEICFYDPADMPYLLWWKEPIFSLSYSEDYLSSLRKTKNFTGRKALRLLKAVQKELQVEKIELFDMSEEDACILDGILCSNEACHNFSLTSIFLHGKKYYEKDGARPDEDQESNKKYRLHADFIFNLPLSLLIDDLNAFQSSDDARVQLDIIRQCLKLTGLDEEKATCSDLFRAVYHLGKKDYTAHQAYHLYKNNIIFYDVSYLEPSMREMLDDSSAAALFSSSPEELRKMPKGTVSLLLEIAKENVAQFESFAFYLADLDQEAS